MFVEGSCMKMGNSLLEDLVIKIRCNNTASAENILEHVFNSCASKQLVLRAGKSSV